MVIDTNISEPVFPCRLTLAGRPRLTYDGRLVADSHIRQRLKSRDVDPGMTKPRYQILALDVDGTLLSHDGTLSPRTRDAVARAAAAGIRPVLCTGRRYRRARPIASQLGLDAPLVCNSGAIIKDPDSDATLWRADLDRHLADRVIELFRDHDQPAVIFTDRPADQADFIVTAYPTGREPFDDYVGQNHEHAEINASWRGRGSVEDNNHRHRDLAPLFHVCAIGTLGQMLAFQETALSKLRGLVQTFVQRSPRYLGTMCEILRHDASKWTAILHLARSWGVEPAAICAVGDDVNDIPMLRHAGLGVAMGHARPEVQIAADVVTGDHDQDGVAMLVDDILLPH
jgi:5-amino-6-(5-phospho-D-ribitylamino)uracil phosphatase